MFALLTVVTSPATQASDDTRRIEENLPAGTAIGEPVTDANLAGQLTHTLVGKDADSFSIDGASGQLQTVEPLDYEVRRKYDVIVRINHDDVTTDIPVTISVLDVEEPGVISVAPATLRAGTVIRGRLTDPDGGVIPNGVIWEWSVSSDGNRYSSVAAGIPGSATGRAVEAAAFTPDNAHAGKYLKVQVRYTDRRGSLSKSAQWVSDTRIIAASPLPKLTVRPIVSGLTIPWDVAFTPDGTMLITERSGNLYSRSPDGQVRQVRANFRHTLTSREVGLMGIAVDPSFSTNRRFYTCLAYTGPEVQVVAWTMKGDYSQAYRVNDPLVSGIPLTDAKRHGGCRIRFGPDGYLWITTGDGTNSSAPQSLDSLGGKVLRINAQTGEGAPDNPFNTRVYTYGHRNPQGLAFDPGTNQAWLVEHGPDHDDEINLLVSGGNYGWKPDTPYSEDVPMTNRQAFPDAVEAKWESGYPAVAPSGAAFIDDASWGAWNGRLAVALLKQKQLKVFEFSSDGTLLSETLVPELDQKYGRLRSPVFGPDGALYVTTSNGSGNDHVLQVFGPSTPRLSGPDSVTYASGGTDPVATFSSHHLLTPVSWTVSGQDDKYFSISSEGVLSFLSPPDSDYADDYDADNVYRVLVKAEAAGGGDSAEQAIAVTVPGPLPEVSIAASANAVMEGGDAIFVLSAYPSPASNMDVSVTVSDSGNYGVTTGQRTITIPGSENSATLTISTTNDKWDEADGSVTVTVNAGSDYTVSATRNADTMTVWDDDDPPPVISIVARGDITEGEDAFFTLSANLAPAPGDDLDVSLTVSQSGDYGATTGTRTVTIPTTGSATLSVATTDDATDEADGSVTVTLNAGNGYTVSATQGAATVAVSDNDEPRPPTLLFDLNHQAPAGKYYHLNIYTDDVMGDVTIVIDGPDKRHFIDYANLAQFILFYSQRYDRPSDANRDGVYEIDLTASASRGGTTKVRMRFTVTNAELISRTQRRWDQLSQEQRATLFPEADSGLLKPQFANLVADMQASVLRLGRQGLLTSPVPTISIAPDGDITEGDDATFTISANPAPASAITVNVGVSESGSWGATGATTVSVSGATTTYTITTSDDEVDEVDGSVTATVKSGSGYTVGSAASASVNVADNDDPPPATPEITISGGSGITEGGTASFTISANPAPDSAITVNVGVSESGSWGATGVTTVSVSGASTTYTITTSDDEVDEVDGSVTATVKSGSGYTVGSAASASVNVADDDVPEITISGGSGITEGGTASFTISANPAPASAITVNVGVSESGSWGATGATTVSVSGATTTYTITTSDDEVDEVDGSVTATVKSGSGYTVGSAASASVNVADNDDPPPATPEITISGGSGITEGGTASFTISANPAPDSAITVNVGVSESGSWGATGVTTVSVSGASTTYTITTSDDEVDEVDGSVTATVKSGSGYTVGSAASASVNVADDDVPEITISGGSGITEGGTASFTISANPAPASAITVNVGVSESGSWGATGATTVSVSGATTTYTITTSDDEVDEVDGSVTATVKSGSGYTVGSAASASVNVADNDDPPPATPEITISGGSGITEGGTASFTISANPAPDSAITVNVGVSESGSWGATGVTTVSVSGATTTYTITTSDDEVDEADGSVTATVKSGSGYTVGSAASASVNVADDDVPEITISGTLTVSIADPEESAGRGEFLEFTVSANETAEQEVTISYTLSDIRLIPGLDYCVISSGEQPDENFYCSDNLGDVDTGGGEVTIGVGEDSATIFIWIDRDAWVNGTGKVLVFLTDVEGAKEITEDVATGLVTE